MSLNGTLKKRKKKSRDDAVADDTSGVTKRSQSQSPVGDSPSSARGSPIEATSGLARKASPSDAHATPQQQPHTARRRHKPPTDEESMTASRSQSSPVLVVSPDVLNSVGVVDAPPRRSPIRPLAGDVDDDSEYSSSNSASTERVPANVDAVALLPETSTIRFDARREQTSSQSSSPAKEHDFPDGPPGKLPPPLSNDNDIVLTKASRHSTHSRRARSANDSPPRQQPDAASLTTSTTPAVTATTATAVVTPSSGNSGGGGGGSMLQRASSAKSDSKKRTDQLSESPFVSGHSEAEKRRLSGPALSSVSLASSMQLEEARSQNAHLKARVERHRAHSHSISAQFHRAALQNVQQRMLLAEIANVRRVLFARARRDRR